MREIKSLLEIKGREIGVRDFALYFIPSDNLLPVEQRFCEKDGAIGTTIGGRNYLMIRDSDGLIPDSLKAVLLRCAIAQVGSNPGRRLAFEWSYKNIETAV